MAILRGNWEGPQILRYPLSRGTAFRHSQAWGYQDREIKIHGKKDHPAHDFAANRGTKLYAPVSGYAICSFHQTKLRDYNSELIKYDGKFICYSLGRFWQFYLPEYKIYIMLAHLDVLSTALGCYVEPEDRGDGEFYPPILQDPPEVMMERAKFIEQGTLLGTMGTSGLGWDYTETPSDSPDPRQQPTWDPDGSHVHVEVFTRDGKGDKHLRFDPFGIYSRNLLLYQQFTYGERDPLPRENMWQLGDNNRPLFAA